MLLSSTRLLADFKYSGGKKYLRELYIVWDFTTQIFNPYFTDRICTTLRVMTGLGRKLTIIKDWHASQPHQIHISNLILQKIPRLTWLGVPTKRDSQEAGSGHIWGVLFGHLLSSISEWVASPLPAVISSPIVLKIYVSSCSTITGVTIVVSGLGSWVSHSP